MFSTDFTIDTQLPLNDQTEIPFQGFMSQDTQSFEDINPEKAVEEFLRIWMREHESPEILGYEETAVNYMFSTIQRQKDTISTIPPGPDSFLLSNLLSLEVRRLSYLVNSYLRVRLEKLVKNVYYYKSHEVEKQSFPENQFLNSFLDNLEADLRTKLLDKLPPQMASFPPTENELESGVSFDDVGPNLDQHVVCRSQVNMNGFVIDDFGGTTDLEPGTILCLPYRFVKELVRNKQADLV